MVGRWNADTPCRRGRHRYVISGNPLTTARWPPFRRRLPARFKTCTISSPAGASLRTSRVHRAVQLAVGLAALTVALHRHGRGDGSRAGCHRLVGTGDGKGMQRGAVPFDQQGRPPAGSESRRGGPKAGCTATIRPAAGTGAYRPRKSCQNRRRPLALRSEGGKPPRPEWTK